MFHWMFLEVKKYIVITQRYTYHLTVWRARSSKSQKEEICFRCPNNCFGKFTVCWERYFYQILRLRPTYINTILWDNVQSFNFVNLSKFILYFYRVCTSTTFWWSMFSWTTLPTTTDCTWCLAGRRPSWPPPPGPAWLPSTWNTGHHLPPPQMFIHVSYFQMLVWIQS